MTKQEYLKSIGYKRNSDSCYTKRLEISLSLTIEKVIYRQPTKGYYLHLIRSDIHSQEDIDNLQIAFNNIKQDFEECMKYE